MELAGLIAVHAARFDEHLGTYLDRLARRVSVLLDLYQRQVEVIALKLLERGELTGQEVQKLLRGADSRGFDTDRYQGAAPLDRT
jgi:hypothetical protein